MWRVTIALVIWLHIRITVQQEAFECGVVQAKKAALVYNGEDAERDEWPWHVALFRRSNDNISYICGGTLISDQFVLTAAHCVFSKGKMLTPSNITTHMRRYNIKKTDTKIFQQYDVAVIHSHPSFEYDTLKDDIALLELSSSVEFDEYVQPACVDQELNLAGENGTTVGWGLTENDSHAEVLQMITMPVIDNTKCVASDRDFFGAVLTENVFCAGYTNGSGVCNGDSGGGMVFQRSGVWYVGGVVSHSKSRSFGDLKCSLDGYGVFTKVQKYIPWIEHQTALKFLEGNVVPRSSNQSYPVCRSGKVDPKKTTSTLLPKNCGQYLMGSDNQTAGLNEFPWMAQVLDGEGRFCAGSLINNRYVLMTASCPVLSRPSAKVRLGEHTIGQTEDCDEDGECAPAVQDYGIQCLSFYPDYDTSDIENSILLIRLDKDVQLGDFIQPVCLPTTAALQQMEPPSEYIVSGWESESVRDVRPLRKLSIQPRNISECSDHELTSLSLETLVDSRICASSNGARDVCIYDSGSPVGYDVEGSFVQFGIVTSPRWCQGVPEPLFKVASFMDWIVANIVA